MSVATKMVFGRTYRFSWSLQFDAVVPASIELYPDAAGDRPVDVEVKISEKLSDFVPLSVNPKIHQNAPGEMRTLIGKIAISWRRTPSGILVVHLAIPAVNKLKSVVRKFRSMEFPSHLEHFEQVLHELVLVPSVYFLDDLAPIHSAAIATQPGALLLAGTGGVGKSSALLALRKQLAAGFIADDIALVSTQGLVYGNMAWPKVYGYNCVGNEMAAEIMKGRGLLDQMHFHFRNKLNPANVRRKISPDRLYQTVLPGGIPLSRLLYLFKEDVPEITTSRLPLEEAVEMSIAVMESEYGIFHRHVNWEEYNSRATGTVPMLTMEDIRHKWRNVYQSAFTGVEITKVSIPLNIEHARYQSEITRIASLG